ncbi:hypothetical protein [Rathayibacter agropyri]|nr:hypothetical protein [Rathayibacter agropyri]
MRNVRLAVSTSTAPGSVISPEYQLARVPEGPGSLSVMSFIEQS